MPRCPVCSSPRVVIVLALEPRWSFCRTCGARWQQVGREQQQVTAPSPQTDILVDESA